MVNKKENPSAEVVVPPILHAVDREMATADHLPPLFDPNIHDKMVLSMESETVDTAEPMSTSECLFNSSLSTPLSFYVSRFPFS